MKKIISIILALCLLTSTVIVGYAAVPFSSGSQSIIEDISVDLTKSSAINSNKLTLGFENIMDGAVRADIPIGWYPMDAQNQQWVESIMAVKDSQGNAIVLESGYKYAINVKYFVLTTTMAPQVSIIHNNSDNQNQDNGSTVLVKSEKHSAVGTYVLSAVADGVANRPLRLAFGGNASVVIDSITIQRVANSNLDKVSTVNYVVDGLKTTEFAADSLKVPEYANTLHKYNNTVVENDGVIDAIFGGWYSDAAFATANTTVTEGATYYAKWASITRKLDLLSSNRMITWNSSTNANEYHTNDMLTITPNTSTGAIVVQSKNTNNDWFANGNTITSRGDAQLSLEYYDYEDTSTYDNDYTGYAAIDSNKQYVVDVRYSVTAISGEAGLGIVVSSKSITGGSNCTSRVMGGKNQINSVGNYSTFTSLNGGGPIDNTYGGSDVTGYKFRLHFKGNATFVIDSVTIQETYKSDNTAGKVVGVTYKENVSGTYIDHRTVAVKDYQGKWQIPEPVRIGDVIESDFAGWYTDTNLTTPIGTSLSAKQSVYPRWDYVKTNVNLNDINLMYPATTKLTITKPTSTAPFTAEVVEYENKLFPQTSDVPNSSAWVGYTSTSLEYYDNDLDEDDKMYRGYLAVEANRKYVVNIKYNVVSAPDSRYNPQIALVSNTTNLRENAVTKIWTGKKHSVTGNGYILSAFIDGATATHKLRLAFGGVGKFEIESIEISEVSTKSSDYVRVDYVNGLKTYTEFVKKGSAPALPEDTNGFSGWYSSADFTNQISTITENCTIYAKYNYFEVSYVDGANSFTKKHLEGDTLANPTDTNGFYGWYATENLIGKVTTVTGNQTVYAARAEKVYSFNIDFDTQSTKDFYNEEHTKSDWATTGGLAELVVGGGVNGSDAMRLTYKETGNNNSDYRTNAMIWLHDTSIVNGDKVTKRFNGVNGVRYEVTLKYKAEEVDGKNIDIYVGTRKKSQSNNGAIFEFGKDDWAIRDTFKLGNTITKVTGEWVTVTGYVTARQDWFPVILLKTNDQTSRTENEKDNPLASILVDDITVSSVPDAYCDTVRATMTYEDYDAKKYDSTKFDGIIGNKHGLEVSTEANHTSNGSKALKLTVNSDSLQFTGNTVICNNKQPVMTFAGAAYKVKFWVMSKIDMDDIIWGVNSVAGEISTITSNHQIEVRNKVDLKANVWKEITAYIPTLQSIPDTMSMLSIAIAGNGYDGKTVYIDDITVEQLVDSKFITFVDSHTTGAFKSFVQRAFEYNDADDNTLTYLPSVSKTGYFFDGWYDTPECDGKEYKVNDKFPTGADELTLYAKWISEDSVTLAPFTAGSFDPEIYDDGVVPYVNVLESYEDSLFGIINADSTQSAAWVKDTGIYGNGTAEYDGTLMLQNDTYSKFTSAYGRNVIALINEDGSKFMVKKGEKYTIKFDYMNGSNQGTSVFQTFISKESGYGTFGYNQGQYLKHIAVHGTDDEYKTYTESFVADYTGFVYITFTARADDGSPHTQLYQKVYIDNLTVTPDETVKKINFLADNKVFRTVYGREGDRYPVFDVIQGDERKDAFDGFYADAAFTKLITDYTFTSADEQNVYVKYKEEKYNVASDFSSVITLDFEEDFLINYYRQGKHMTYWQRGELNPEWQLIKNDTTNANSGSSYIKLNGYATYWNEAKIVMYDPNNPSNTMLLTPGELYRVKIMTRCEDIYDLPNLTLTFENPSKRYLDTDNDYINLTFNNVEQENGYMCYTADVLVPENFTYLPALTIRKNRNDLQTLFIDTVSVEKLRDCSIKFEENGGTEIDDYIIQIHEQIADPGMPFKDGYDFVGWYSDAEFKNLWNFDTMTVEDDLTLYAKWKVAVVETPTDDTEDEELVEEEIDYGVAPELLDGDAHTYPSSSNMMLWNIIIVAAGGAIVLSGIGIIIWIIVARKKKKTN